MTILLTALYFAGILLLLALMESNAMRERAYKKATDGLFNRGIDNSPVVGLNALDAATRCSESVDGQDVLLGHPEPSFTGAGKIDKRNDSADAVRSAREILSAPTTLPPAPRSQPLKPCVPHDNKSAAQASV